MLSSQKDVSVTVLLLFDEISNKSISLLGYVTLSTFTEISYPSFLKLKTLYDSLAAVK